MKKMKFATLAMCLTLLVSCNLSNAVKGGGIGTIAGTLAGGVIGKLAGNTAVGAAVGAAVGGTTGALIGKHMDKVKAKAAQVENAKVEEFTDANNLKAVKVTFDSGILFQTGKADLNSASQASLSKFAQCSSVTPNSLLRFKVILTTPVHVLPMRASLSVVHSLWPTTSHSVVCPILS